MKVKKLKSAAAGHIDSTPLDALLMTRLEWNPGKSAAFMCAKDRGNGVGQPPGGAHNKGSPKKTPAVNKLSLKERLAARQPTPYYPNSGTNIDLCKFDEEDEYDNSCSSSSSSSLKEIATDGKEIKIEEAAVEDTTSDTKGCVVSSTVVHPPVQKKARRG